MPKPPHLVFDCEVLTPMFLAGAEQNGAAELRAPSVRGMLRYWYRALLGGRGYTGVALAREEAKVFGSAGMGDVEACASAVDVVVRANEVRPRQAATAAQSWKKGVKYLWHFTTATPNNRGLLDTGSTFQVALVAPRPPSRGAVEGGKALSQQEALQRAGAAFWLLTHFGGLGTRSRRGAGSFRVRAIAGEAERLPSFARPRYDNLWDFLEAGLQTCTELVQTVGALPPNPPFDVLQRDATRIMVTYFRTKKPLDVVEEIGSKMQAFRCGSSQSESPIPEIRSETIALKAFYRRGGTDEIKEPLHRAGFGLPHMIEFKRERALPQGNVTIDGLAAPGQGPRRKLTRRASPLLISVIATREGEYEGILTYFRSAFLPSPLGEVSRDLMATSSESRSQRGAAQPNARFKTGLIDRFLEEKLELGDEQDRVQVPA